MAVISDISRFPRPVHFKGMAVLRWVAFWSGVLTRASQASSHDHLANLAWSMISGARMGELWSEGQWIGEMGSPWHNVCTWIYDGIICVICPRGQPPWITNTSAHNIYMHYHSSYIVVIIPLLAYRPVYQPAGPYIPLGVVRADIYRT